jgi:hypothetical protein
LALEAPAADLPGAASSLVADVLLPPIVPAATEPPPIALAATRTERDQPAPAPSAPAGNGPKLITDGSLDHSRQPADQVQNELIAALEADIRRRGSENPSDEELPRLEQRLRLAYLAAGRLDDAVKEVSSLDAPQREAYKQLLFGLGVWLSPDEARRPPLRSAKVLRSLREATTALAAASKLEVRNLAFCTKVDSFGWYTEFPRYEFLPKQQVILYVEVDNFAAERKSSSAYETELQGSYQIFDSSGHLVAERQLELDKEICRNFRRDYFLRYVMYMPAEIGAGRYRLELTIEDLKARGNYQGRKFGEGMIEFSIRQ